MLLLRIAEDQGDTDTIAGVSAELTELDLAVEELRTRTLLTGEYDARPAVVVIHAGAGDADATDFAEMLLRMYLRWAGRHGYRIEMYDRVDAFGVGIQSATFIVAVPYAYGMLSVDAGLHRLVRTSPLDRRGRRQTRVATVEVAPLVQDDDHLTIAGQDIRVDLFCSQRPSCFGRAGTSVLVTHLPTGIRVACHDQRKQRFQRETALRVLRSRLLVAGVDLRGEVRSYVLGPDQLAHDPRTGHRKDNVAGVFDGDIDAFIAAGVRWRDGNVAPPHAIDVDTQGG